MISSLPSLGATSKSNGKNSDSCSLQGLWETSRPHQDQPSLIFESFTAHEMKRVCTSVSIKTHCLNVFKLQESRRSKVVLFTT